MNDGLQQGIAALKKGDPAGAAVFVNRKQGQLNNEKGASFVVWPSPSE